jgi:hypothetical protein
MKGIKKLDKIMGLGYKEKYKGIFWFMNQEKLQIVVLSRIVLLGLIEGIIILPPPPEA